MNVSAMAEGVPKLNIIGCGHVSRTLGRLWHQHRVFTLQDIVNRHMHSAAEAVDFIGSGNALTQLEQARAADVWMIGTPDASINLTCGHLAESGLLSKGDVVFHCSGALPSSILNAATACGAAVASLHPIRSFANPQQAGNQFTGTWCGAEGDEAALAVLEPAFRQIGAQIVHIDPGAKSVYHGAAVFASNYLVTLIELALQAYEKAGVPRETAHKLIEPLVRGTVDNVFSVGTENALSGPIARRDGATVLAQYRALKNWDRDAGRVYKALVRPTKLLALRRQRRGR